MAALNTLAGYIDWVSLNHITAENCKLVETLCLLLNEQELQLGAAECLLIAVSRKVSKHFALVPTSACGGGNGFEPILAAGVLTGAGSQEEKLEEAPTPILDTLYIKTAPLKDSTPSPISATNWGPLAQVPERVE